MVRNMEAYVEKQIQEHESTFDNDNIRDFIDFYVRTTRHGDEKQRKYLTSRLVYELWE